MKWENPTVPPYAIGGKMGRIVKLDEKGRILIPREVRIRLFLKEGDTLPLDVQENIATLSQLETALKFTHPSGTHDDCLWGLALSVYADYETRPSSYLRPITKSFG